MNKRQPSSQEVRKEVNNSTVPLQKTRVRALILCANAGLCGKCQDMGSTRGCWEVKEGFLIAPIGVNSSELFQLKVKEIISNQCTVPQVGGGGEGPEVDLGFRHGWI